MSIRVLIADDHKVVRQGLRHYLETEDGIEVIGEAGDGAQAIEQAVALEADVVLMDIVMPRTNGVEATLRIREARPETQVIVLTSFLEDETVRDVLRAGAAGYVMKEAGLAEVADAIRTVHRGDPLVHPDVLRRLIREFAGPTGSKRTEVHGERAGTVTIAFTDIENSSALVRKLGDTGSRPLFREHDRVTREALEAHGGREVSHLGDGFMLAFDGAHGAVTCAIDIQRAFVRLADERLGDSIRVRVGIHTGEVIAEEHGYFGEAVYVAARIGSKAEGGQILVSDLTRRLVGGATHPFTDRGEFELRGLPGVYRLFEVAWQENGWR